MLRGVFEKLPQPVENNLLSSSDLQPYPGFESFPYKEYSEAFFGSEYKVLRGGSWATRPGAIRNTFRNWDYPIRRQIFSGFRCASDD